MTKSRSAEKPTDFVLAKLFLLIDHLKSSSLPVADELKTSSLMISQTLADAYTTNDLELKKTNYKKTLTHVRTVMNLLLNNFEEEIISPFRMHIIYEDLKTLSDGLDDIIKLLENSDLFETN